SHLKFTYIYFFSQAEDGIRDFHVTGVQTCALPIWGPHALPWSLENGRTCRRLTLPGLSKFSPPTETCEWPWGCALRRPWVGWALRDWWINSRRSERPWCVCDACNLKTRYRFATGETCRKWPSTCTPIIISVPRSTRNGSAGSCRMKQDVTGSSCSTGKMSG